MRLQELSSLGLTQQLSKETTLELGSKYGEGIAAVDGNYWVHVDNAKERLGNIIQYNGLPAKFSPKKWYVDKYSLEVREGGELAILRSMCSQ